MSNNSFQTEQFDTGRLPMRFLRPVFAPLIHLRIHSPSHSPWCILWFLLLYANVFQMILSASRDCYQVTSWSRISIAVFYCRRNMHIRCCTWKFLIKNFPSQKSFLLAPWNFLSFKLILVTLSSLILIRRLCTLILLLLMINWFFSFFSFAIFMIVHNI